MANTNIICFLSKDDRIKEEQGKIMKKLFITFAFFILSALSAFSMPSSDILEIRTFLHNLNKYSNEHNIEAIKEFYSKDYVSYDGFNYDGFFASVNETFKTYPDISYKSKIKSIKITGNFATAEVIDTSYSKRQTPTQSIINNKPVLDQKLDGIMESKCHYVMYLKKNKGKWSVYSDNIISEETAIKYGKAKDINIDILSPHVVNEGDEYCITLNVEKKPKNAILLASLSREEIKYPPTIPQDIFKKVPKDGTLERMVKANKKGINEYSLASIGMTEISLNDTKTAINYEMSGIAFLMKRVNVYPLKNAVDKTYVDKMLKKEQL